jgi:glutathione S-transferase
MRAVIYLGNLNYSSWSVRGALLVRLSGVACDEEIIPLDRPRSRERIRSVSASGRVPCLHHDGLRIWDTLAIAEYLHEISARIWPADRLRRAQARAIVAEMHAGFQALRTQLPMDIRSTYPTPALDAACRADIDRIADIWTEARAASADDGEFLFGAWSGADCFYVPVVSRFRSYGIELSGALERYADAVWAHPEVARIVAAARAEPWTLSPEQLGLMGPRP